MALANEDERRVARQVEQLRACAGDSRPFNAERVQRWLAWWETNRQVLDLRGSLPRQAYTLVLLGNLRLDPRDSSSRV